MWIDQVVVVRKKERANYISFDVQDIDKHQIFNVYKHLEGLRLN